MAADDVDAESDHVRLPPRAEAALERHLRKLRLWPKVKELVESAHADWRLLSRLPFSELRRRAAWRGKPFNEFNDVAQDIIRAFVRAGGRAQKKTIAYAVGLKSRHDSFRRGWAEVRPFLEPRGRASGYELLAERIIGIPVEGSAT